MVGGALCNQKWYRRFVGTLPMSTMYEFLRLCYAKGTLLTRLNHPFQIHHYRGSMVPKRSLWNDVFHRYNILYLPETSPQVDMSFLNLRHHFPMGSKTCVPDRPSFKRDASRRGDWLKNRRIFYSTSVRKL